MERLTSKCSTILIARDDGTQVYHSLESVPEELREQLFKSTRGMNSATILIADEGGREEILKSAQKVRDDRYAKLVSALKDSKAAARVSRFRLSEWLPVAGRVILVGCLGYVLWVLATLN